MFDVLAEANRAAAMAQAARVPGQPSTSAPQAAAAAPSSAAQQENWLCSVCNNLNLPFRTECNRCGKANPKQKAPAPGTIKDVLKVSPEELVMFAQEKMHPNFNKALLDIGVVFSNGRVQPGVFHGLYAWVHPCMGMCIVNIWMLPPFILQHADERE